MRNFSEVSSVYLSQYRGMEDQMPVYFCIFLIIYIIIIVANLVLIGVIYREKTLHEPMYLLVCNLSVNELWGSTALLPALLVNMQSGTYEMSVSSCLIQTYAIHTYAIAEFGILAVMSYDRYVAICYPLSYHTIMSQRVVKLIVLMWLYPMLAFLSVFSFTLRLSFCDRVLEKVYCVNYLLVKLSCTNTFAVNIVGLLSVVAFALPQLIMIFYSYTHILKICLLSFIIKSKFKAFRTCTPHLLTIINYTFGCVFETVQGRFNSSHLSYHAKLILSLYFLIFPPLLNPAIYGLSNQLIRARLLKLLCRKMQPNTVNA
ncbi:olfactory receptor 1-like [Mugil cephalus]|uniref:olfactory receptor 1-like n=1 Tax=Mugil cephalus TaxID=48193 RepID=UPI001FB7CF55|nr:olfactory receptor 1-like [Mugil cephalus]